MTECIGCGCSDAQACEGGCSWVIKSPLGTVGVCSNCIDGFDLRTVDAELSEVETFALENGPGGTSPLILPGDVGFHIHD